MSMIDLVFSFFDGSVLILEDHWQASVGGGFAKNFLLVSQAKESGFILTENVFW